MDPSLRQVGSSSREERFRVGKVVSYEQEELSAEGKARPFLDRAQRTPAILGR